MAGYYPGYPQNPYMMSTPQGAYGYTQGYQPIYPAQQMVQNQARQAPPTILSGRFVQKLEDITPNDVTMDGSMSYFPVSDGSCIYVKFWKQDGTIGTIRFVPETVDAPAKTDSFTDALMSIQERLDKIEKMLSE